MPYNVISWAWEEAFDKFGFGDGDEWNGTHLVSEFLDKQGWEVECHTWGMHNYMIDTMKKGGQVITVDGYSDPREYLPEDLVKLLDVEFAPRKLMPLESFC